MNLPESAESLDAQLITVLETELSRKNERERDKSVRRFIDFCVKELEDLKLINYLHKNPKSRMELMMALLTVNNFQQQTLFYRLMSNLHLDDSDLMRKDEEDLHTSIYHLERLAEESPLFMPPIFTFLKPG